MRDLTKELDTLGYHTAITARPQDLEVGLDYYTEEQFMEDENYDLFRSSFSLLVPEKSAEYNLWLAEFICDELNFFDEYELRLLMVLHEVHTNWVKGQGSLNKAYWVSTLQFVQNH